MITVGQLLREKRLEKRLTLEQVERATKIRSKFLENLEKNEFDKFNSQTILRGFIRNYATYLDVSLEEIMAFYRRQANDSAVVLPPKAQVAPEGLHFTPRLFTVMSVILVLVVFVGILISQYLSFTMSPPLEILSPKENTIINTDEIEVVGKTDPDAALTINNEVVQTTNGQFRLTIPLISGLNTITFKAVNKSQKETTILRHLRVEK